MSNAPTTGEGPEALGSRSASPPVPTEPVTLLPCPFCGAHGEELGRLCDHAEGSDNSGPSRRIQCYGCHIGGPFYDSEAEAVAAWNTRAMIAAAQQPARKYDTSDMKGWVADTVDRCAQEFEGSRFSYEVTERLVNIFERTVRETDARAALSATQQPVESAAQRIIEANEMADHYKRLADQWRGIAAAMGYEPKAHLSDRPTAPWLVERIAKYRADAGLPPAPNPIGEEKPESASPAEAGSGGQAAKVLASPGRPE